MGKLGELISNQTIRIDNHHRGDGIQNDFNDRRQDVHIHKEFKDGDKRKGCNIRIPLNSTKSVCTDRDIPKRILKEIQNVLNDPYERENFISRVCDELKDNWKWEDSSEKRKEIARKIAKAFDLELLPTVNRTYYNEELQKELFLMIDRPRIRLYKFVADKDKGFSIGEVSKNSDIQVYVSKKL